MTDDFSAISGEEGAYVPCNEVALAFPASLQDTSAIYGEDEGFVAANTSALADEADDTDTSAAFGRSAGLVPGPCVECDDFEEFDGTEAIGWGSNTDDTWTRTGDGNSSVLGGYGRMDLFVPGVLGPADNSREVRFVTDPTTIRTQNTWTLRTKFSVDTTTAGAAESETLVTFSITNGVADQSAITFYWVTTWTGGPSTSGALAVLQVDENGSTIYNSGFDPVTLDANGSLHEMSWTFTQGGTQSIYLDGGLILSGPSFTQTFSSFASTSLHVQGLLVKSGAFLGSATATMLYDYFRFCEE